MSPGTLRGIVRRSLPVAALVAMAAPVAMAAAADGGGGAPVGGGGAPVGGDGAPIGTTTTSTTPATPTTTTTTPTGTGISPVFAPPAVAPLAVTATSLAQAGRQLVWSVRTSTAFSPNELNRDGRELCLLIERPRTATVVGELCVKHPGDRRHPSLAYRRVTRTGAGPARTIDATVTRSDAAQLTAAFEPSEIGSGYRDLAWQVWSTTSSAACTAPVSELDCGVRSPATPSIAHLHSPIPSGCTVSGPAYVTNGSRTRGKVVALTVDDGPWYDTPQFLSVLEQAHVVATFFQIGDQVSTYGRGVDARMLADGDLIGDHTWDHANVSGGGAFAASEITRTRSAITALTGFTPCLFRAPYGAVGSNLIATARSLGFTTIEWDVDPRDWARPGADAIYNTIVGGVAPGSIVLQHDGGGNRSQTLAALPREIATLKARGYRFVTVAELLGLSLTYR